MIKRKKNIFVLFLVIRFSRMAKLSCFLTFFVLTAANMPWGLQKCYAEQEKPSKLSITGTITNLEQAKKYLTSASHLLLINMEENLQLTIGLSGNIIIVSDGHLKVEIPSEGTFTLEAKSLKSGNYLIFVQDILNLTMTMGKHQLGGTFISKAEDKQPFKIEIPEQSAGEHVKINLGEVVIRVP